MEINATYENLWGRLKTYENLWNPCNRSIREACQLTPPYTEVHGVRGRHNECLISFTSIFDFENLCESIRNHAYSLKSIKAMENIKGNENQCRSIKINEMSIFKTYENLLIPCSRSIRTRSAIGNHCKSVRNHAYSLKSIKSMKMHENNEDP